VLERKEKKNKEMLMLFTDHKGSLEELLRRQPEAITIGHSPKNARYAYTYQRVKAANHASCCFASLW